MVHGKHINQNSIVNNKIKILTDNSSTNIATTFNVNEIKKL